MSSPGTPNTNYQPLSFDQAIQFYWDAPSSVPAIDDYRLTLNYSGGSLVFTPAAADVTFIATGLTNNVTYSATLEARNANGYSAIPGTYRDWQPGVGIPGPPSTVTATLVGATNAILSWTPPAVSPTAPIYWYVIEAYSTSNPLPVASYSANGLTQSNYFITGLNSNLAYYFNVSAVNYPDYSRTLSTNTIQYLIPFSPTQISGMNLWLDAQDSATVLKTGNNVYQWSDKSGSNNHAYNPTATAQPIISSINGYTALGFYGSNSLSTNTLTFNNSNYSIFFVNRHVIINDGWRLLLRGYTASGNTVTIHPAAVADGSFAFFTSANGTDWNDLTANTPLYYMSTPNIAVGVVTTSVLAPYWNGNVQNTKVGTTTALNRFTIGNGTQNGNQSFNGQIGEVLQYNVSLTPFNRQKVEGYLAWKWGIQSNLPTIHPFRAAAPYSNSVFAPPMFSTLRFWYDAQDSDTVIRTGNSVTQWNDKSSNALHMRRVGVSTILYNTTAVNNYPGLYFSTFAGLSTSATVLSLTSQLTYFMVLNQTQQPSSALNSGIFENAADYRVLLLFNRGATSNVTLVLGNTTENGTGVNITGSNTLLGFTTNATTASFQLNASTILNFTPGTAFPMSVSQPYRLAATGWTGNICEVMAYSNALSTPDRQTVEGYLAWKWGLQGNLPVTHPYVLNNPGAVTTNISVATTSLLLRFDASTYSGTGTWSNTGNLGITHNATRLSGTPTKNAAGNGIVFNGATSTLAYTVPNMSAVSTVFTLSTWVKRLPSFSGFSAIFTQDFTANNINFMLGPANTNSQVVQVGHFTSAYYLTNSSTMPLNTWFNFTATFDGTIYRLYENGNATTTYTPGVAPVNNGSLYYIGRLWSATYFTGEVGQLLVYNRALTAAEVLQNYAATSNTFSV
jgi:hypothetical protein